MEEEEEEEEERRGEEAKRWGSGLRGGGGAARAAVALISWSWASAPGATGRSFSAFRQQFFAVGSVSDGNGC